MKNLLQTHTRIAHETHTRMAQNTHTDCTQTHTYFYRWSFSPLKHGRKHTHTWNEHRFFFRMGAPATINIFAFLGTPGALNTVKNDTFGTPGALSQKNSHTHWPRVRLSHKKTTRFAPKTHTYPPIETRKFRLVGISLLSKTAHTHTDFSVGRFGH